ncbi:MAG: hypothetical protein ACPGJS_09195 [Flammeovirgaceae bacterium]
MSSLRNYTVQTVHIQCPFDTAWDYLNDPINQKEWAIHFYKDIQKVGNQYIATTPFGEVPLELEANETTHCIDLSFGGGTPVPSRLIESGENSCLYVFVLFQPAGMPDAVWATQGIPNTIEELKILKKILEEKVMA